VIPLPVVLPGHYNPAGRSPFVAGFEPDLKVMGSKNRPRRVAIIGDDGVHYKHLLKGQEDMRLDERVMQLLGLVNTLLEGNLRTANRNMQATTYAVTPLSDNVGLVGWVDNCDTLHDVIRRYRAALDIPTTREWRLIESQCGERPERLALMQKLEMLEYALDNTDGMEIARVMWVRSPSAEGWLDVRTTYVRTLASQSMIGYVLGLGDRHPSNLMLAKTGRIVHIDFGDCFEVAMLRQHIPERIPFRLTRMLQLAMEPAGIDGLFRHTCEAAMSVLRSERDNLMAMLEAFIHDPLIGWRLVTEDAGPAEPGPDAGNAGGVAMSLAHVMTVGSLARPMTSDRFTEVFVGSLNVVSSVLQSVRVHHTGVGPQAAHTQRAREVVGRVRDKLMGKEDPRIPPQIGERVSRPQVSVHNQVARLISQATSNENLCQSWKGWCAFW
jgi:FKBP12-rapamycin complex-associated protein